MPSLELAALSLKPQHWAGTFPILFSSSLPRKWEFERVEVFPLKACVHLPHFMTLLPKPARSLPRL